MLVLILVLVLVLVIVVLDNGGLLLSLLAIDVVMVVDS